MAASLANFLRFNGYPLFTPEVGLVMLGIVAIALIATLAHRASGWSGRAMLEGLLVLLVVDLSSDPVGYALVAGMAAGAFVYWRKRSILPFLAMAAFIALLVGFTGIGEQEKKFGRTAGVTQPSSNRPALLHVILDEHVGIEGLPADNKASPVLRDALKDFYLSRGFRLFGRAYSEHMHTVNAIPHVLGFGAPQTAGQPRKSGYSVGPNPYFSQLGRFGYQIHVHQSDFLDYCAGATVASCTTYSTTGLSLIPDAPLSTADKAKLLATRFALLSTMLKGGDRAYQLLGMKLRAMGVPVPRRSRLEGQTSTANAVVAFDMLVNDLRDAKEGEAYFAHMLVPHYPYAVSADCTMRATDRWRVRREAASRGAREAAYFDQIRCATRKLDAALRAFAASPGGKDGIVIVHGDHGSRITGADPTADRVGRIADRDLIAAFSTLFAVRAPDVASGYETTPVPVALMVKTLAQSDFTSVRPEAERPAMPTVILDDTAWVPRRPHLLPGNW